MDTDDLVGPSYQIFSKMGQPRPLFCLFSFFSPHPKNHPALEDHLRAKFYPDPTSGLDFYLDN